MLELNVRGSTNILCVHFCLLGPQFDFLKCLLHQSMILIKAVYPKTLVNTSSLSSLYERFQSAASHFICVLETVLNFWRPFLSSSTNTSHPLRGSLSSFGANPTTRAFLQALFNWFHLTQTSDGVSFTELRDTGPSPPSSPFSVAPQRRRCRGLCVGFLSSERRGSPPLPLALNRTPGGSSWESAVMSLSDCQKR